MRHLFLIINLVFFYSFAQAISPEQAEALFDEAYQYSRVGDIAESQQRYQEALQAYKQTDGMEEWESMCYYSMAIPYLDQRDITGLAAYTDTLATYHLRYPEKYSIQYDYYSLLASLNVCQYEVSPTDDLREAFINNYKEAVRYMEKLSKEQWKEKHIQPVWNYYNIAVSYDLYYDTPQVDSIDKYLTKAIEVEAHSDRPPLEQQESLISLRDEQAWLFYYKGEYKRAEQEMLAVLALIDTVQAHSPNTVITERGEAYTFLVELYEHTGRIQEALDYQKLLTDNNLQRYSIEKNRALHEVETHYQVAQKEEHIQHLRQQNLIFIGLSVALVLILAGVVVIFILLKRRREQAEYDAAVEADLLRQSEQTGIQTLVDRLCQDFPQVAEQLRTVNTQTANNLFAAAEKPLSIVDKRYLFCFMAGLKVQEIAKLFHVEPESVYTVRYRLRRKFPTHTILPF